MTILPRHLLPRRGVVLSVVFGLFAAACLTGCAEPRRPDGGVGLLPEGTVAPDIAGDNLQGKSVRLSELRGKSAVVFFYPKDGTPGCTKEACAFRDAFSRYQAVGVTVFGVSRDSASSHKQFAETHKLPFALVADESGDIAKAYGVPSNVLGMSSRVSFLVGPGGRIAKVFPDVDPAIHADEVLKAAHALALTSSP